jgi:ATP-dependent Clp protease adaptor protein ClpS
MGGEDGANDQGEGALLLAEPRVKSKKPSLYKVVMLNDDFTPMDFVVEILKNLFHKSEDEAVRIMLEIHQKGAAICGIFTLDIAETKADLAMQYARLQDHPLQCIVERE